MSSNHSYTAKKIQTKSTISKSLAKTEPVFDSGNKTLEHKSTDDEHTYISKVVGCLWGWGRGGSTLPIFFFFFKSGDHNMTRPTVFTYPENAHEAEVNIQNNYPSLVT